MKIFTKFSKFSENYEDNVLTDEIESYHIVNLKTWSSSQGWKLPAPIYMSEELKYLHQKYFHDDCIRILISFSEMLFKRSAVDFINSLREDYGENSNIALVYYETDAIWFNETINAWFKHWEIELEVEEWDKNEVIRNDEIIRTILFSRKND